MSEIARNSHVDVNYHCILDVYKNGDFESKFCGSSDIVVDIVSKKLYKVEYEKFVKLLNVVNSFCWMFSREEGVFYLWLTCKEKIFNNRNQYLLFFQTVIFLLLCSNKVV